MLLVVKDDVPADPVDVRLLGPPAVVPHANRVAHAVKQPGRLSHVRAYAKTVPRVKASKAAARHVVVQKRGSFFSGRVSRS
jgi:hypothetical protein